VKEEMKVDTSPKEPEYNYAGSGEGVIGGVATPPAPSIEDAPAYATAGFKKPTMESPGCVQRTIRLTQDMLDYVKGPVTVKFAVLRDGTPSRFEVMTPNTHDRIAAAIWQAVRDCKWVAGADAQARATNIWVILPLRFNVD
jgi:protein TonB